MSTNDWFIPLVYAGLGALVLYLWLRLWSYWRRRSARADDTDYRPVDARVIGRERPQMQARGRPDRQWLWGTLTEREMQIARLVEQGKRNAEIAQELNLSVYTVQVHLRHIYSKLNIRGRGQLVKVMHDEGL